MILFFDINLFNMFKLENRINLDYLFAYLFIAHKCVINLLIINVAILLISLLSEQFKYYMFNFIKLLLSRSRKNYMYTSLVVK